MKKSDCKNGGFLLMRIVLAVIFIVSGLPKAMDWGMSKGFFAGLWFLSWMGPIAQWFGPLVGIIEVIGGLLLIAGIWHKWTNYILGFVILVATLGVHFPAWDPSMQRNLLMLAAMCLLAWNGPGKFSLKA
ncbi:DoxX family protein [Candidatus Woesearchaeota archaeon]|nr:DoxX family protein [Candidatus Woesearchaeota archaeon]